MRRLLPLILLVFLGIGCGGALPCPHGAEFRLRAVPQPGERLTPLGMQAARTIIAKRLDVLGVRSPIVTIRGDEVVVGFSGGTDYPNYLDRIAWVQGQLQVFDFERDLAQPTVKNGDPTPYTSLYSLLSAVKGEAAAGTPQAYYLLGSTGKHLVLQGPDPTRKELLVSSGGKQPAGSTILAVPAHREVVKGPGPFEATPGTRPVGHGGDGPWYLFKLPPALSADDFKKSAISSDVNSATAEAEVKLGFTAYGTKEFAAITKAEYDRGGRVSRLHGYPDKFEQRYAQHSAIVVDNYLDSVPYVDYRNRSLSGGIRNGFAVIANMFSPDARNLAIVLRTGSLPYFFKSVSAYSFCRR